MPGVLARGRSVAIDEEEVLVPECDGPFGGMTYGQATVLNFAVAGLRVEIRGGGVHDDSEPKRYRFEYILLPGALRTDPFTVVGDLHLTKLRDDGEPNHGIGRVVSPLLVRSFTVLEMNEARVCETCGAHLERTAKVYDTACLSHKIYADGEFEWRHRWECSACWWTT